MVTTKTKLGIDLLSLLSKYGYEIDSLELDANGNDGLELYARRIDTDDNVEEEDETGMSE